MSIFAGDGSMIGRLVQDFNDRAEELEKYRSYYLGDQPITFIGEKLQTAFGAALQELSCNRCGNVIDVIADRLKIEQFTDTSGKELEAASELWLENAMEIAAGEIHTEALMAGDAFVIVWPDMQTGRARFYVNYADRIAISWDAENPREIEAALKLWRRRDGSWRANLYYRDRLEKYASIGKGEKPAASAADWAPWQDAGDLSWPIAYREGWAGRVPVFHFANNARAGEYGISELKPIIPLQDRYNLTLATLAIAEEHQSYRQRWATGIQPIKDDEGKPISPFTAGAGQLWVSTSKEARFGDFEAADLTQFEKIAEGWEAKIARTARIPLYYLLMGGDPPSGEMLKTSEAPFVAKIEHRARHFGATWSDIIEYAIRGTTGEIIEASVEWRPAESRSELEFWQTSQTRRDRGVSDQQILREWGYSDEEIESMLEEIAEKGDQMGEMMASAFNRGTGLQGAQAGDDEDGELEDGESGNDQG